jgi:hypothetical protein
VVLKTCDFNRNTEVAQGLGWTLTAAFAAKLNRTSAAAAKFLQGIAADVLTKFGITGSSLT